MKLILFFILIFFVFNFTQEQCYNFDNDYNCNSGEHDFSESWDSNCFQTPPRNDIFGRYKPSYQDMHYLVGYAQLKYSQDQKSCNVIFKIN